MSENRSLASKPDVFRAGISKLGDFVYGEIDILPNWDVSVSLGRTVR